MNKLQNQDVLLSVKPQYANLIVDGMKSVELRRRFPTDLPEGTRCLIYSSSPTQKVIGECKIESVKKLSISQLWKQTAINAMISWDDFSSYFSELEHGYAVKVYASIRYDKPKDISKAAGMETKPPQSYRYLPGRDGSANL